MSRSYNNYLQTRTANFFINQYKRDSLTEAVELAAQKELDPLLPEMSDCYNLPIDVERVAKNRGIILGETLPKGDHRDAAIFFKGTGYSVRMGSDGTPSRDRFSLAHEIGHTLFFEGTKHRIGILNRQEIEAEEYICNMFAEALLMPRGFIEKFITRIPKGSPWSIFKAFENTALQLKVSIPALIWRTGCTNKYPQFPFIALYLRYKANKFTGKDQCVRIVKCSTMGSLRNTRIWSNKSAAGINMHSTEYLFASWLTKLPREGETSGGRYTISNGKLVRAKADSLDWIEEKVEFSVCRDGKWHTEIMPMMVANCLYASHGWKEDRAYIISIVKPKTECEYDLYAAPHSKQMLANSSVE